MEINSLIIGVHSAVYEHDQKQSNTYTLICGTFEANIKLCSLLLFEFIPQPQAV